MKYIVNLEKFVYATVEVEADDFDEAKAKAEDMGVVDSEYGSDSDGEVYMVEDEDGNQMYYA